MNSCEFKYRMWTRILLQVKKLNSTEKEVLGGEILKTWHVAYWISSVPLPVVDAVLVHAVQTPARYKEKSSFGFRNKLKYVFSSQLVSSPVVPVAAGEDKVLVVLLAGYGGPVFFQNISSLDPHITNCKKYIKINNLCAGGSVPVSPCSRLHLSLPTS